MYTIKHWINFSVYFRRQHWTEKYMKQKSWFSWSLHKLLYCILTDWEKYDAFKSRQITQNAENMPGSPFILAKPICQKQLIVKCEINKIVYLQKQDAPYPSIVAPQMFALERQIEKNNSIKQHKKWLG